MMSFGCPLLHAKRSDAQTAGYVSRMQAQYDHTDEKPLVRAALDRVMDGRRFGRALDIGPGPGDVTGPLSDRSDQLTLVELNEDYRAPLSDRFPRAELIIDSIHNRSFPAVFDAILFSHGFYYLSEAEWLPFARRMMGFLEPGGSLFIVMNNDVGDGAQFLRTFWAKHPELKTHSFPQWTDFKRELSQLGVMTSHSLTYHWSFHAEETVSVLGSAILALPREEDVLKVAPELHAYANTLAREGGKIVMNVGADVVELRRGAEKQD